MNIVVNVGECVFECAEMHYTSIYGLGDCFIQQLHNKFALKDMGDLHYFLGIEVSQSSSGSLHLCQRKYIRELLARSSMSTAKSVHTSMLSSSMLSKDEGDCLADPIEYRSLAGALQYLRDTLSYGLLFRRSERLSLVRYADANWGLDFDDRRSTTGFCVYYGHTPISWCSKKQQVVSRSTAEAEYRSLAAATMLSLLQLIQFCSPSLNMLNLICFFVREKEASGELIVGEVPACDQVADILTKPLSVSILTRFHNSLWVIPLEEVG
ncbi:hypothetical protein CXB51_023823 [Gossypium anomalum]|uniref:Reverse transcriptase Ty1/copia-type domain-containing protein n=1 Tax=Gossypium anomalum TaxID=47600 RepID=A0A8J5YTX0_9ROSI|nr:hypothetical protein CXB51_023823 [Gossypium anomalum]